MYAGVKRLAVTTILPSRSRKKGCCNVLRPTCRGLIVDSAAEEKILVEIDQELMPVVPEYLENRHLDCAEIEQLLGTGGMESIQVLGHRMKGSGGSFGFDEISIIGEDLELAAQITDVEGIKSAVVRLERYLARVSVTYL
jgi:HPt (histidine-containing phosphotransfer) domain-containing protein